MNRKNTIIGCQLYHCLFNNLICKNIYVIFSRYFLVGQISFPVLFYFFTVMYIRTHTALSFKYILKFQALLQNLSLNFG